MTLTTGDAAAVAPQNWLMGKEAFEGRMPHHNGIKALWETKWKFPVSGHTYGSRNQAIFCSVC